MALTAILFNPQGVDDNYVLGDLFLDLRKHRKGICEAKLVLDNAEIQLEKTITYIGVTWTTV